MRCSRDKKSALKGAIPRTLFLLNRRRGFSASRSKAGTIPCLLKGTADHASETGSPSPSNRGRHILGQAWIPVSLD